MSYQPPPGPPGQQYPPQQQGYGQGWNQAPQGYGQPQGSSPYPQQGGFAPPQGPPPGQPGGFAAPPGPPPGQQWNQQPPPGQWNQPPPGQWNQPPPGPPPGQYQQQAYGHQPPMNQQGQYAQQPPMNQPGQHFQQPPPGNYGPPVGAPSGPSIGYIPGKGEPDNQSFNAANVASKLRNSMKGIGTDEAGLVTALGSLNPEQVVSVKAAYRKVDRFKERDLMKDVHSETSGYFREGLEAIIRGPLEQDCHALRQSIKGLGTKESAMNDVLLGRSNADLNAIKQQYRKLYGNTVESDVKGDLSMKTERLFDMVMAARRNEESAPVVPQQIDADVQEIYRATEGTQGTDELSVCTIMSSRSDPQLRAIAQAYKQKYQRSLDEVIRKEFSGHMEDALLFMLRHAEDPAKLNADLLEESMKGAGTKDAALVRRIVAVHWDQEKLRQCKAAYKHFYKRDLTQRIAGETSGDYEKLMLECIQPQKGLKPY